MELLIYLGYLSCWLLPAGGLTYIIALVLKRKGIVDLLTDEDD